MAVFNFIFVRPSSPHHIFVVEGSRGPGNETENDHRGQGQGEGEGRAVQMQVGQQGSNGPWSRVQGLELCRQGALPQAASARLSCCAACAQRELAGPDDAQANLIRV